MEWSIKESLARVGEEFSFSWTGPLAPETFGGLPIVFAQDVAITGTYRFDGKAVLAEGRAEVALTRICARCTEPFVERLTIPLNERYLRESTLQEDDESRPLAGDRLQLLPAFWDNLYLQLPIVAVCSEDCRGLCPACGGNRNLQECSCAANSRSNAFSVLAALYQDNEEV
ncbi:MAG: DUF177 domain-containing protein [Clostridiales bacterium]|nr:DUF177 domain-containing protein [Clostridiales bacterium]